MNINLYDLFDGAQAAELEPVLSEGMFALPAEASLANIKTLTFRRAGIVKKSSFRWQRCGVLAAGVCLMVAAAWGATKWQNVILAEGSEPAGIQSPRGDGVVHVGSAIAEDFDSSRIVWGTSEDVTLREPEPDKLQDPSASGDQTDNDVVFAYSQWNSLNVSNSLSGALLNNGADAVFAVGARSLLEPDVELSDFRYNGKTYEELRQQESVLIDLLGDLTTMRKWASYAAETGEDVMEMLLVEMKEEFINQYYSDGIFDMEAITMDEAAISEEFERIEMQIYELKGAFSQQHDTTPDLSLLSEYGYYVVNHNDRYFVMANEAELAELAETMKLCYSVEILENTVFTLASPEELGIEDQDMPEAQG